MVNHNEKEADPLENSIVLTFSQLTAIRLLVEKQQVLKQELAMLQEKVRQVLQEAGADPSKVWNVGEGGRLVEAAPAARREKT